MKLICNFKKFKEVRREIEEFFQTLIAEELYNSEAYYGVMPDDSLKAGCDGTANIVIEEEKDISFLMDEYKFDIMNGIVEFVNIHEFKRNKFYCFGYLCNNEFMVLVYLSKRTLDKFSVEIKDALTKMINDNGVAISQASLSNAAIKKYFEEFENYKVRV